MTPTTLQELLFPIRIRATTEIPLFMWSSKGTGGAPIEFDDWDEDGIDLDNSWKASR